MQCVVVVVFVFIRLIIKYCVLYLLRTVPTKYEADRFPTRAVLFQGFAICY